MMQGFNVKSSNMTMGELVSMSKELQGLRSIRLTDEGNYAVAVPKQIIREDLVGYSGLPELIMAEEFANIPVTLGRDYVNYKLEDVPVEFRGIFNYDLNKHLIENLMEFRANLNSEKWLSVQSPEVQERLRESKFYTVDDGKRVLKQKQLLCSEDYTKGDIIDHINSYSTELVFYADPQAGYRFEPDTRFNTVPVFYRVDSQEEADALGVEKGAYIQTPLLKFINYYNSAFNKLYMNPIREKYPNISNSDFRDLPEVEEANKHRLVSNPNYVVITLMNRVETNAREEIEVEPGSQIPTYLNKMQLKSHHFEKYFKFPKDSDAHFEPSYALMKVSIPKRDGDKSLDFKKQYEGIKFNKPEVTMKNTRNDKRVPNLHPADPTFTIRFKEAMLDFPFKQAYVTSGSQGFSAPLKLSAIYEIIRNISLPIYVQLEDDDYIKENLKNFLMRDLSMTEEQLNQRIVELNQTGGQFSGAPTGQQAQGNPPTQPQGQPAQAYGAVPPQGGYAGQPAPNPYGGQPVPPQGGYAGQPPQVPPVAGGYESNPTVNPYVGQPPQTPPVVNPQGGQPIVNPGMPPVPPVPPTNQ